MISAKVQRPGAARRGQADHLSDDSCDTVFLVPELCHLVGPSEMIMTRKASQKEIKKVVRVDAPVAI